MAALRLPRRILWQAAGRIAWAHPFTGIGPDNFRLVYGDYLGLEAWDRRVHANDMYLEILVGAGLLGLAALVWLLGAWGSALLRRCRDVFREALMPAAAALAAWVMIAGHGLVDSFLNVGWVPVDAMLAWEHPQAPGHFVVVEGNARTTALRMLRREHDRELQRLAKARGSGVVAATLLHEQEQRIEQHQRVIAATREIEVLRVEAPTPAALERALPRLLGVRHISHAASWAP